MQSPVTMCVKPACRIDSVRFSPDGRYLAWIECWPSSYDLVCYEVATGRQVVRRNAGHHWYALAWAGAATLAAWAEKKGARDADQAPWTVEFIAVPEGKVVARHTLPADVSRQDSPHLHGASGAARVLVATTRSTHRGASAATRPGRAWVVDATTGAAVWSIDVASVLPEAVDAPLALWALSPDGARVAVSSFPGSDRADDVLHCFTPDGASRMAKGHLHQPEWIDERTVLTRGLVANVQTVCVARVGDEAPRLQVQSPTLFAFGAVNPGPEVALFEAATGTFTMRSVAGDERLLGTRADFEAPFASPRFTWLAANVGGATRVLIAAAEKLSPAKRASVPGSGDDASPPALAITLSDALTGDTVYVHGVAMLHVHDLHGLFNPVELHVDPSGRSLALMVRRATSKKRYAEQHHDLVVCDVAAVLAALQPRKPAKKPRVVKG